MLAMRVFAAVLAASVPVAAADHVETNVWYKSLSEKGGDVISQGDNGARVLWGNASVPVKKQAMVHKYFNRTSFKSGDKVTFTMQWESDGFDGSNDPSHCDTDSQLLRCMAGTGDFRIGLYESGSKRVGNNFCEGKEGASVSCPDADLISDAMDDYKGFHVRVMPHLSSDFLDLDKWEVKSGSSNIALWTRKAKVSNGAHGLMSDSCHRSEGSVECGHTRDAPIHSSGEGNCKDAHCRWGPDMPFAQAREVKFELSREDDHFTIMVTFNGQTAELHGEFDSHFAPDSLDTFAIAYTHESRKYQYVEISDWKVESSSVETIFI
eukprot:TRINITY_DN2678_c0_g1_i2.p1 TRINITY_DN2678_c0_g1~~TRINITY_DN2678_c0_g1_i2.p1  ORF type:complete len:322 (-),score=54.40 TRINITY_DN2678_c0_g1_i2:236-1201(-)